MLDNDIKNIYVQSNGKDIHQFCRMNSYYRLDYYRDSQYEYLYKKALYCGYYNTNLEIMFIQYANKLKEANYQIDIVEEGCINEKYWNVFKNLVSDLRCNYSLLEIANHISGCEQEKYIELSMIQKFVKRYGNQEGYCLTETEAANIIARYVMKEVLPKNSLKEIDESNSVISVAKVISAIEDK